MLVDDDRNILTSVSLSLESEGFHVETYLHPEEAYLAACNHDYDLIILDVKMPKMDGMEFLQKYRQHSTTPVVFLTSKDDEIDQILGLRMGANDYIIKPFSQRLLVERLRTLLRSQKTIELNAKTEVRVHMNDGRLVERQVPDTSQQFLVSKLIHDLNGSAASIAISLDLFKDATTTAEQALNRIRKINRKILINIEELRYYVQKKPIRQTSFKVLEVLEALEDIFSDVIVEEIEFNILNSCHEGTTIRSSREFLVSVLNGLLDNAFYHAFSLDRVEKRQIVLSAQYISERNSVKFAVSDNGNGIKEDTKRKLFFSPIASSSGLGSNLYLSKQISLDLNWDLVLAETGSSGTKFTIEVPCQIKSDKP